MIALICFVLAVLASPFKSNIRLEAENAVLRHQLIILRRKLKGRARLTNNDRWFFVQLYRWFPSILKVLTIIQPETLVRWHKAGFRCYWRWKSRPLGGRPQIETELRALIRRMSVENPLWGAPRIHGELLKLGFEVAQSSVAKYMVNRRGPPSQGWRTFLQNHAPDIAAMDLFVVPTIRFDLLYALVIVRLDRRDLIWINVTANPTAEWVARQITEAFPWDEAPHYLIRDRDRIYGSVVTRRLCTMGIRDKPTAPASPWQNGFVERLIGSILEQGCAGFSPGAANRCDQFTRHPGRTSSPLRPCLSCRYTQVARGFFPVAGIDQIVEIRNLVVHRAARRARRHRAGAVTIRNAAIHTARGLIARVFFAQRNDKFPIALHALGDWRVFAIVTVDLQKACNLAH